MAAQGYSAARRIWTALPACQRRLGLGLQQSPRMRLSRQRHSGVAPRVYAGRDCPRATENRSSGEGGKEFAQLALYLLGASHSVRDLLAQQFPVAPAQAVGCNFHRRFAHP